MIDNKCFEKLVTESIESGSKYLTVDGALQSVTPPASLFGYTYWSHMVPPVKPKDALILGYGWGTVPELIRMIHGENLSVTGVDLVDVKNPECIKMNAYDYVEKHPDVPSWDYICVDLWNGAHSAEFVLNGKEFVEKLRKICKGLLCINIEIPRSLEIYQDHMNLYKAAGFNHDRNVTLTGNLIEWFSV